MWRGGMSPIGSRARTRPVKGVVVGCATAESPADLEVARSRKTPGHMSTRRCQSKQSRTDRQIALAGGVTILQPFGRPGTVVLKTLAEARFRTLPTEEVFPCGAT